MKNESPKKKPKVKDSPEPVANAIFYDNLQEQLKKDMKEMLAETLKQQQCTVVPQNTRSNTGKAGKRNNIDNKYLKAQALVDGTPVTYCWFHVITANLKHNSKTCTSRKDGQKEEATYDSRMGGSSDRMKLKRRT